MVTCARSSTRQYTLFLRHTADYCTAKVCMHYSCNATYPQPGTMVKIAGWGVEYEGSEVVMKRLRSVTLPVVLLDVCQQV